MEKIRLSKLEKKCLRHIGLRLDGLPSGVDESTFSNVVRHLEHLQLVKAQYLEGGIVFSVRLSSFGQLYLTENPALHNPIPWNAITAICMMLSVLTSILALLIACSK